MNRLKMLLLAVFVICLGVGVSACGSDSDSGTPTPETSEQVAETGSDGVEGVTWQLMNIGSKEGWATSVPGTIEPPTLEIQDGQATVFSGCNSGTGKAEVTPKSIDFGPIAMTKKACDESSNQIEGFVNGVLEGKVTYEFTSDGNLALTRGKNTLTFIPQ